MARLVVTEGAPFELDLRNPDFNDIESGELETINATLIRVVYSDGEVEEYRGTFVFGDGSGIPTAGVIRQILSIDGAVLEFEATGLDIPAAGFVAAIETPSQSDDLALIRDTLRGADEIIGGRLGDVLDGYAGADDIIGGGGGDVIRGGGGSDDLRGQAGQDDLFGGGGADELYGGNDTLRGGSGNDEQYGGNGRDTLEGGGGRDELNGGGRNDRLFGGSGGDTLNGQGGADVLEGGAGADIMNGGGGADRFVFASAADSQTSARDTIQAFRSGADRIDLRQIDANEGTGADNAFDFIGSTGFSATAGELRLSGSNVLLGDTDGDGSADFAIRVQGDTVAESDILL